ncbi:hypothetical protein F8M41_012071 [Gigaspora margarita]|uniref:Uncharacterized protein n=1 Tax=Gigaspora margarita TaxID=4874 RepID=A0A8H3WYD1_GIGMA|nr:hypothetical protein F8M41_012071 [Gigaspora margarita]
MCDYEVPNEDETDHIISSKDEIDYVMSSKELFNEETEYKIRDDYESSNEAETYDKNFLLNGLLNSEKIFNDKKLVDKVVNNEGPDKIVY